MRSTRALDAAGAGIRARGERSERSSHKKSGDERDRVSFDGISTVFQIKENRQRLHQDDEEKNPVGDPGEAPQKGVATVSRGHRHPAAGSESSESCQAAKDGTQKQDDPCDHRDTPKPGTREGAETAELRRDPNTEKMQQPGEAADPEPTPEEQP